MIKGQTCSTCAAYSSITNECRALPPTAAVVQSPTGQTVTLGVYPASRPDGWCFGWKKPLPVIES